MTVSEIGWFAAGFHLDAERSTSGYQYRYNELIRGFDLPARKKIKTLSKGMRAKVSLSLALASDPELLDPRRADLRARRAGSPRLPRKHGRPGRRGPHGVCFRATRSARSSGWPATSPFLHRGKLLLAEPLDELKARTFLLSVTFASRDHPVGAARGKNARADRCRGRPAAGALAGPRRRPLGLRDRPGASGSRIARDRNAEPRGNLRRLHAGATARAGASAGRARGVIRIKCAKIAMTPARSKAPMYARLWWKDARQFWPIWVRAVSGAAVTQWMMLSFVGDARRRAERSASRPSCGRASMHWPPGPRLSPGSAKRARSACSTSCPPIDGSSGRARSHSHS